MFSGQIACFCRIYSLHYHALCWLLLTTRHDTMESDLTAGRYAGGPRRRRLDCVWSPLLFAPLYSPLALAVCFRPFRTFLFGECRQWGGRGTKKKQASLSLPAHLSNAPPTFQAQPPATERARESNDARAYCPGTRLSRNVCVVEVGAALQPAVWLCRLYARPCQFLTNPGS